MTLYSLNEIEVSTRKAARGAGMAWGLAEETGKAARWLAARGLPSVAPLLALLQANDGQPYAGVRPQTLSGDWRAAGGCLCPVVAGCALSDMADASGRDMSITLYNVRVPLLVLPILGRAAKGVGCGFAVSWPGAAFQVLPDAVYVSQAVNDVALTDHVTVERIPADAPQALGVPYPRTVRGIRVSDADWAALQDFAARTYVPASEESRIHGAGAGLRDDD